MINYLSCVFGYFKMEAQIIENAHPLFEILTHFWRFSKFQSVCQNKIFFFADKKVVNTMLYQGIES